MTVRLQKFLADAGVASRRAGEQMILEGKVSVNGEVVRTLGSKVDPMHDRVNVDGRAVKAKKKLYIAVHKPPGYICSLLHSHIHLGCRILPNPHENQARLHPARLQFAHLLLRLGMKLLRDRPAVDKIIRAHYYGRTSSVCMSRIGVFGQR